MKTVVAVNWPSNDIIFIVYFYLDWSLLLQKYNNYADHDMLDDEGEDSDYSDRKWSGFVPPSRGRGHPAPARPAHNTDSSPSDYAALLAAATKTGVSAPGPYDSPLPTPPKPDDNPSEEEGELQTEPTEPPTQNEAPQKTERSVLSPLCYGPVS